jgi:hypothetical protein
MRLLFTDCNNYAARQLTEDRRWHAKIKHFRVRCHTIWDLVNSDELKVLRVRSSENVADILTKPLDLQTLYVSGTIWVSVLHPLREECPDVQISTSFFSDCSFLFLSLIPSV